MSFAFSPGVDPNRVFLTSRSALAGRLDPFHYTPDIVRLEEQVRKVSDRRLRDFAVRIAGGATPSRADDATHYTDADDGVPFLRVQNVLPTGRLNLADCKRITRDTHEGLLSRSRLRGGELLITITGRVGSAAVVPEGFEGNINQHIVMIETEDRRTSETLAAYLNLDIAGRLALRRATGGTRPALDYPVLLSLPVIFDERIPELFAEGSNRLSTKLQESRAVFEQIDDYLIHELGVELPREVKNDVESRIFLQRASRVSGTRIDPFFHEPRFTRLEDTLTKDQRYTEVYELGDLHRGVTYSSSDEVDEGHIIVRANNIDLASGELILNDLVHVRSDLEFDDDQRLRAGDVLVCAASGSKEHAGKVCYIDADVNAYFGGFMMVLRCKSSEVLPEYLTYYMQSSLFRKTIFRHLGGTNINNLSLSLVYKLGVLVPGLNQQRRICETVRELKQQAKHLRVEALAEFEATKRKIEMMVLAEA